MIRKVSLTALLCCVAIFAFPQMVFKGKVIDFDGNPIPQANVWLEYTTYGTATNNAGEFVLKDIPEEKYQLRISAIGHRGERKTLSASQDEIVITMTKSPLKLNDVVITGTGTINRLKTSPTSVEVISQKEIKNAAMPTFESTMSALSPSFSFTENAMGSYMQLGGLSNRYVLVLVDGKKLAGDVGGNTDLSRINMNNVKRIEILKGASSSLYGAEAMGGVINIITNQRKERFYATTNTRYAKYGQLSQTYSLAFNSKIFSSATDFQRNQSDGWQLSSKELSKGKLIETDKKAVNQNYSNVLNQKFTLKPTEALNISVHGSLFNKKYIRPVTAYTYDQKYDDYSTGFGARYLLKNKGFITLDSYMDNYEYTQVYIKKSGNFEAGDKDKVRRQRYYDTNLKGVYSLNKSNKLSVGMQSQIDYLNTFDEEGSRDVYTLSFYAQDEIKLLKKKLQFVPGLRLTHHETFGNRLTPKLSSMYSLKDFNFRLTYAAGFRAPDIKQLYSRTISKETLRLPNPDLKPEKSNYFSAGIDFNHNNLTIATNAYINKIDDIIILTEEHSPVTPEEEEEGITKKKIYRNVDKSEVMGFDVSVNSYFGYGLSFGIGYAYTNAKDCSTNKPLPRTSKHIGNMSLNWSKKWWKLDSNINFNGRIQSKRYYDDGDNSRPYNIWNLATTHQFINLKDVTLIPGFGIENIFNFVDDRPFGRNYATLSPGRTFYVSLNIKFQK